MKLAHLRKLPEAQSDSTRMRGTEAQDSAVTDTAPHWRRYQLRYAAGAAAALLLLFTWLIIAWLHSGHVISRERLRIAAVNRGHFVRDVAAEGTVVAAVNPTLFAIAPGTVAYAVRAGEAVKKGEVLATLESPELNNEYQRERATLESLDAALNRQQIEIRRQIMSSQQQSDLARWPSTRRSAS
jgi:HlyD family secretion protein